MTKHSRTTIMMKRGAKSDSIPMDLIPEILSRLPTKSIARFRCVSKPWKSIICGQYFTKLFHTISLSNPRLLIGVEQDGEWSFFSSPRPQDHYGKSSIVVAADFHSKLSNKSPCYFSYASSLLYFPNMWNLTNNFDDDMVPVICNPSTGQYVILPPNDLKTTYSNYGDFLGYDPIGKQFKVLVLDDVLDDGVVYHILTLGTEKVMWRKIKCPSIARSGICINRVFYYIASSKICCFDVRSEKFKFLNGDTDVIFYFQNMINYKGKLCGSNLKYGHDGGFPLKLRMWVLEDVEKGEWSAYAYTLSAENKVAKVNRDLYVIGVIASGEIVLGKQRAHKPFYVFYFNPDTNTLLSVEIQGIGEEEEGFRHGRVYYSVDHVEDLSFDVKKIC